MWTRRRARAWASSVAVQTRRDDGSCFCSPASRGTSLRDLLAIFARGGQIADSEPHAGQTVARPSQRGGHRDDGQWKRQPDDRRAPRGARGSFRIRVTRRTSGESLRAIVLTPLPARRLPAKPTTPRPRGSGPGPAASCVCCTAHWSHRNSADSQSFARATRFSGWKKNARSSAPTRMRHAGSRRTTCAISCASAARCCSVSSCSRNRSGSTICRPASARGTAHVLLVVSRIGDRSPAASHSASTVDRRWAAETGGPEPRTRCRRRKRAPNRTRPTAADRQP